MGRRLLTSFVAVAMILWSTVLTVTPAAAATPADLFFSEYIEGSSNNKALEIYNGTGAAVDLTANGYNVQMFFNGSAAAGLTLNLTGTVGQNDVFVIAQSSANAAILAQADQTNGAGWFNGDDAVVLRKGTTVLDVIGQIGSDPGTEWGTGLASTADNTLRRKAAVTAGDTIGGDAFDPAAEWDGFATDTFTGLGSHSLIADLFFSEYIEGSSNNKALEIFNGTGAAIDLAAGGYDIQMCFNGSASCLLTIPLTGVVGTNDVYVVAQATANATILAQADQTNASGWFNGDDAVLLRKAGVVIDSIGQLGFDPGTEWGTGLTSTADNTLRRKSTITAGDSNTADLFDPSVEWNGFAIDTFDGLGAHGTGDVGPTVASTVPANGAGGIALNSNIVITFSEPVNVIGLWYDITCASGPRTATSSGGPTTFTLDPTTDFAFNESCTVTVLAANVTDQDATDPPDNMAANFMWTFNTEAPPSLIREIQGATHISPKNGLIVSGVAGIVTTKTTNGFWMQDPAPDADDATSEGIFVFTSGAPTTVTVGDAVTVSGRVSEFRPGTTGLTITELVSPTVVVRTTGNPLPPAIAIGPAGRVPPTEVIEDDAAPDVETSGVFDPASDGIDFWESLEGMRVDLGPVVITGPSAFDEIGVLANNGAGATGRTARGGIVISATDKNPEKVLLRGIGFDMPDSNTGDHLAGSIVGVVGYDFNNFMVEVPVAPTRIADGATREVTTAPGPNQLTIATFNVENLDPGDATFATMANLIVNNLRSPDIISLEEIQDNDGPTNTAVVSADVTLTKLRDAVVAAGGPTYDWRLINPVDDQDGGEPGGNIRQAFFFRTDRGVAFVDRPGAGSTTSNAVVNNGGDPQLQFSPGRLDPTNPAFNTSRKPLAAEFTYNGHRVIAVANHWNSKGGDDPLWGHRQPPILSSEAQRVAQATVVRDFVQQILAIDASAKVVVLGDLNDFEWSAPLMTLKSAPMNDLIETLPANERYTYVFEGNSQTLDHILVSNSLLSRSTTDVVHVNAEFWDQASDHDPQVATITLADTTAPTITVTQTPAPNTNGWNNTNVTVAFTCADDVAIQSCVGSTTLTAETAGTTVTGTATDTSGNTATASTTVRIDKTAPTFTWTGATTYGIDDTLALDCAIVETLSGVDPALPSFCDDAAGPASALGPGTYTLMAAATDRAGNSGTATLTFTITVDDTSLCGLVRELVTSEDVAAGLCDKLAAAAASLERGNTRAHDNQLRAFANQVEAQRGKSISDADADLLLELATLL
jgi:predicted extracellular nuclease